MNDLNMSADILTYIFLIFLNYEVTSNVILSSLGVRSNSWQYGIFFIEAALHVQLLVCIGLNLYVTLSEVPTH